MTRTVHVMLFVEPVVCQRWTHRRVPGMDDKEPDKKVCVTHANKHQSFYNIVKRGRGVQRVELSSTFRNGCGNEKLREISVAGYVTLGNFSCTA